MAPPLLPPALITDPVHGAIGSSGFGLFDNWVAKRAAGGGPACRCGAWALVGNRALWPVLGVSTRQFGVGGFSGVGGRGALTTVEVPLPAVSGRSGEWPRRRERGVLATCDLILHGSLSSAGPCADQEATETRGQRRVCALLRGVHGAVRWTRLRVPRGQRSLSSYIWTVSVRAYAC